MITLYSEKMQLVDNENHLLDASLYTKAFLSKFLSPGWAHWQQPSEFGLLEPLSSGGPGLGTPVPRPPSFSSFKVLSLAHGVSPPRPPL